MSWQRGYFRGDQKVWIQYDDQNDQIAVNDNERAKMRYDNSSDAKVYSPHVSNVNLSKDTEKSRSLDLDAAPPKSSREVPNELASILPSGDDKIKVYTDGACSGNPGPAGYGFVILRDGDYYEQSQFLGEATNNIAELKAIHDALEYLNEEAQTPIELYTDSRYSLGVLTKGWKAKKNTSLIDSIHNKMEQFEALDFYKVEGHAGHPFNERADTLATSIIE